ncbi:Potassium-transporting ATPase KdpC subunit [Bienertia sinuspersici]
MEYVGGQGRTFMVDVDELCWWFLREMALKCGNYSGIEEIYYLIPHSNMDEGLRRVYNDKEVLGMADIVMKNREIVLYVVHTKQPAMVFDGVGAGTLFDGVGVGSVTNEQVDGQMRKKQHVVVFDGVGIGSVTNEQVHGQRRKKLTPWKCNKQGILNPAVAHMTIEEVTLGSEETPPNSDIVPFTEDAHNNSLNIPHQTLSPDLTNNNRPQTAPSEPKGKGKADDINLTPQNLPSLEDLPLDFFDYYDDRPESPIPLKDLLSDGETGNPDPVYEPENEALSDDLTSEDFDEEGQLEDLEDDGDKDEFRSDVEAEQPANPSSSALLNVERHEPLSEYEQSDEEIHTPVDNSEEEGGVGRKPRVRSIVVSQNTDWNTFVWSVGQRFTTREAFREAVAHYVVAQGNNQSFVGSNKNQLRRLEAKCLPGCPFKVYGSWDNRTACFVVKSLEEKHTCNRNMVKNKQLKATWLAKQFLEIFKSRPHWPAKEIKETHKSFKGEDFKLKFWTTCKSYNMVDFDDAMKVLAEDNTAAELAFKGYSPSLFCRAFLDTNTKVDVIVKSLGETFNGYIINPRTKQLIYMLEEIRSNLMQRLVMKRMEMEKHNKMLCPRARCNPSAAATEQPENQASTSTSHLDATAQPSRTGGGGRFIRGWVGSKGGSRGGRSAGGRGKGGRGRGRQGAMPVGQGLESTFLLMEQHMLITHTNKEEQDK